MDSVGFSVVIPTSNRPVLALKAIKSVLNQSYKNVEIIVVNNGSSKSSVELYDYLLSEIIDKILYIDLNNDAGIGFGPSIARNVGIEKATYEYIAFCDDDDEWTYSNYLSDMSSLLSKNEVDIVISDQEALFPDGKVSKTSWYERDKITKCGRVKDTQNAYFITSEYFYENGGFPHLNTTIYNKKLLDSGGGFCREFNYEEDFELFFRLSSKAESIIYYDKVISRHFIPDKSKSTNVTTESSYLYKQQCRLYIAHSLILNSNGDSHLIKFSVKNGNYAIKRMIEYFLKENKINEAISMSKILLGWGSLTKNTLYLFNVFYKNLFSKGK